MIYRCARCQNDEDIAGVWEQEGLAYCSYHLPQFMVESGYCSCFCEFCLEGENFTDGEPRETLGAYDVSNIYCPPGEFMFVCLDCAKSIRCFLKNKNYILVEGISGTKRILKVKEPVPFREKYQQDSHLYPYAYYQEALEEEAKQRRVRRFNVEYNVIVY